MNTEFWYRRLADGILEQGESTWGRPCALSGDIVSETVAMGTYDGDLVVFGKEGGDVRVFPGVHAGKVGFVLVASHASGIILYSAGWDGRITARGVDPPDGDELWSIRIPGCRFLHLYYQNDSILAIARGGEKITIAASSGTIMDRRDLDLTLQAVGVAADDLFLVDGDGGFHLCRSNGVTDSGLYPGPVISALTVMPDETVVLGDESGILHALSLENNGLQARGRIRTGLDRIAVLQGRGDRLVAGDGGSTIVLLKVNDTPSLSILRYIDAGIPVAGIAFSLNGLLVSGRDGSLRWYREDADEIGLLASSQGVSPFLRYFDRLASESTGHPFHVLHDESEAGVRRSPKALSYEHIHDFFLFGITENSEIARSCFHAVLEDRYLLAALLKDINRFHNLQREPDGANEGEETAFSGIGDAIRTVLQIEEAHGYQISAEQEADSWGIESRFSNKMP